MNTAGAGDFDVFGLDDRMPQRTIHTSGMKLNPAQAWDLVRVGECAHRIQHFGFRQNWLRHVREILLDSQLIGDGLNLLHDLV